MLEFRYVSTFALLLILLQIPLYSQVQNSAAPAPTADKNADKAWEVMPHPVGIGGIPAALVQIAFPEPVPHDPRKVLEVRVTSPGPVNLLPVAQLQSGQQEVLLTRRVPAGENLTVRWSLDDRLGMPNPVVGVGITASQDDTPSSITLSAIRVVDASSLSEQDLLDACYYEPLNVKFHQVDPGRPEQEAVIVLPLELVSRHPDGTLHLILDGAIIKEAPLRRLDTERRMFIQRLEVPLDEVRAEGHVLEAYLQSPDGTRLKLGSQKFSAIPAEFRLRQFEVPYQSIESYAAFYWLPDLGLMTVAQELYSRAEPNEMRTNSREAIAHAISLSTGNYESQLAMRAPAYANWAAGGYHSIAIGNIEDSFAFYITGTSTEGIEYLGLASTAGKAPVKPFFTNPVFHPAPELAGWKEGTKRAVRGNTIAPYLRSYLMLNVMQAGNGEPIAVASISPDLRVFADAGVLPIRMKNTGAHLDLSKRGDTYYLLNGDPKRIWTSRDPLRKWKEGKVALPENWEQPRLVNLNEEWYLFGLVEIEGRRIVRFVPVQWSEDGLPVVVSGLQTRDYGLRTTD